MAWLQAHWTDVGTALFFLSEALALIPEIKANSVFQLLVGLLPKPKAQ